MFQSYFLVDRTKFAGVGTDGVRMFELEINTLVKVINESSCSFPAVDSTFFVYFCLFKLSLLCFKLHNYSCRYYPLELLIFYKRKSIS